MTIDDKDIIRAIREKSETGFRLLMQKYKQPVYWHIRRLVVAHDDAQDATQEAFIRIFRSFDKFRDDNSFRGWIFRIATNEALRLIDSRKQEQVSLEEDANGANRIMATNYVDYTDLEALKLQKAILSLPAKQQAAFNLRYYDELSYEEIVVAIGSTASAAKVNFHIAKEKIIKYMNSND
jgi:RNA polymerase sigma-70 factor, ECF subfamily